MKKTLNTKEFEEALLIKLKNTYDFSTIKINSISLKGHDNITGEIYTNKGVHIFKLYRKQGYLEETPTIKHLQELIELVENFKKRGIPTFQIVTTSNQDWFFHINEHIGYISKKIRGSKNPANYHKYYQLGIIMSKMHQISIVEKFSTKRQKTITNIEYACNIETKSKYLNTLQKEVINNINTIKSIKKILINGDLHFENVIFNKKGFILGLIDFDDFRMDTIYEDLAWTIVMGSKNFKEKPTNIKKSVENLLNGYNKNCKFEKHLLVLWTKAIFIRTVIHHKIDTTNENSLKNWLNAVESAIKGN